MPSPDPSTEARFLEAARTVFVRHGMHAASPKEIARASDVNQALLHYCFSDEETLADTVSEQVASGFTPEIQAVFVAEQLLEEKIVALGIGL